MNWLALVEVKVVVRCLAGWWVLQRRSVGGCSRRRDGLPSSRRLYQQESDTIGSQHYALVNGGRICRILTWIFNLCAVPHRGLGGPLVSVLWISSYVQSREIKGVLCGGKVLGNQGTWRCLIWGALLVISDWLCYTDTCFLATVGQKGSKCSPDL